MRVYDLTDLKFALTVGISRGTGGSFFKARDKEYYYKLSYVSGTEVIGFESVYEAIANELLEQLRIPHASGELLKAKIFLDTNEIVTNVWKTKDFNPENNPIVSLETEMQLRKVDIRDGAAVLQEISKFNEDVREQLYKMVLFDYIIRNVDRHGANIELMYVNDQIRCTPVFDNGSSFFSTCQRDVNRILEMDVVKDSPVNNFIGSLYLEKAAENVINEMTLQGYSLEPYSVDTSFLEKYSEYFDGYNDIIIPRIEQMINERTEKLNALIMCKRAGGEGGDD